MKPANPINIQRIDHVVLRVTDLEKMVTFYSEVLGCQLERYSGDAGIAQLRAGQSLIDLVDVLGPIGRQAGGAPDRNATNMDHVCLHLNPWDSDTIRNHLRQHGVAASSTETRYGAQGMGPSIYMRDPEGNRIELKGEGEKL